MTTVHSGRLSLRRDSSLVALSLACTLLITLAAVVALLRTYETDEFSTFFGAAGGHVLYDIPNNPPLFNLLAAFVQWCVPPPWSFLLPVVCGVLAGLTVVRIALRHEIPAWAIAAALLVYANSWIDLATYYKSFSLLALLLLLAFDAWERGDARRVFVYSLLASLTHHLGSFMSIALVMISWLVGPRLPWWTLAAVIPGLGIAVQGVAAKVGGRGEWGMSAWSVAWTWAVDLLPALYFALARETQLRRPAVWALAQYAVLVLLAVPIPFRDQYLWILTPLATLIWAAVFQTILAQPRFSSRKRLVVAAMSMLVIVGVAGAVGNVWHRLGEHQNLETLAEEIRSRAAAAQHVLFYPNSDLLLVHYAFEGFAPVPRYSINAWYDSIGPFRDPESRGPSDGAPIGSPPLRRFTASNGGVLDVATLRQPFVVDASYDCLILQRDYAQVTTLPAAYQLEADLGTFLVFVPARSGD